MMIVGGGGGVEWMISIVDCGGMSFHHRN